MKIHPYLIPGLKRKHDDLLEKLSKHYSVEKQDITGKSKKYSKIKREAMYLMKTELDMEDSAIAVIFDCNRSSVFRSVQKQQAFMKVYPEIAGHMKVLRVTIKKV